MKKISTILLLLPFLTYSKEYQLLQSGQWVYDVEVVVLGRQLAQPDALSINNRTTDLDVPVHNLLIDYEGLPLLESLPEDSPDADKWQVPIEGDQPKQQALVWVLLQKGMNHPVIRILQNNPSIRPLIFQKWRQPATRFLSPEYVAVSTINKPKVTIENDFVFNTNVQEEKIYADYSFEGVVAYSKQKFNHVTVKMNFYRHDPFGQIISYAIDQKQRIKLAEWQYFDHQQFGVMVKVTPISIEPTDNGE